MCLHCRSLKLEGLNSTAQDRNQKICFRAAKMSTCASAVQTTDNYFIHVENGREPRLSTDSPEERSILEKVCFTYCFCTLRLNYCFYVIASKAQDRNCLGPPKIFRKLYIAFILFRIMFIYSSIIVSVEL